MLPFSLVTILYVVSPREFEEFVVCHIELLSFPLLRIDRYPHSIFLHTLSCVVPKRHDRIHHVCDVSSFVEDSGTSTISIRWLLTARFHAERFERVGEHCPAQPRIVVRL